MAEDARRFLHALTALLPTQPLSVTISHILKIQQITGGQRPSGGRTRWSIEMNQCSSEVLRDQSCRTLANASSTCSLKLTP
jgi:hypothetical protein